MFCTRGTNQSARFLGFLMLRTKFTKFLSFLKQKISFSSNFAPPFGILRHISAMLFIAETWYTFRKSSLSECNLVIFQLSSRKSEILYCGELLLQKSYKVSPKKVRKIYLLWPWRVMQGLKENWLLVSNTTWGIW